MSELPTTGARLGANSWVASLAPWDDSLSEAPGFQHSVTLNSGAGRVLRLHGLRRDTLPLYAHNDACGVIFDGVLFDRPALCAKLGLAGDLNLSDAELVLKSYQRDGESFLRQIRGLFAVVIWDSARNTCLWARDHLGFFPLYYAQVGQGWSISTAIDVLKKYPGVPSSINRLTVVDWLLHRWENETFWESIERLLPGHAAQFDSRELKTYRYWDPLGAGEPEEWLEDGAHELFHQLFDQAVARCLSLGKSGIFLSGGLDSISVAAATTDINRKNNQPLPLALSLIFPDEADESDIQKRIAQQLGIPQIITPLDEAAGANGLLRGTLEISRQKNWPFLNIWLPAYYALAREAKARGYETILNGEGGDEFLGVGPDLAADLIRSFDFVNLYRIWRSAKRSYNVSPLLFTRNLLWRYGLRPIAKRAVSSAADAVAQGVFHDFLQQRHLRALPDWLPIDPVLREALHERVALSAIKQHQSQRSNSYYLKQAYIALDHPLISLDKEERFESKRDVGISILSPYWDVDLVDMLFWTSPQVLNWGNRSKGLVREDLAHRFPQLGFERQKKVLATQAFDSILMHEGVDIWKSLGGAQALSALGIAEVTAIETAIENAFAQKSRNAFNDLWFFLSFEVWLRSNM